MVAGPFPYLKSVIVAMNTNHGSAQICLYFYFNRYTCRLLLISIVRQLYKSRYCPVFADFLGLFQLFFFVFVYFMYQLSAANQQYKARELTAALSIELQLLSSHFSTFLLFSSIVWPLPKSTIWTIFQIIIIQIVDVGRR